MKNAQKDRMHRPVSIAVLTWKLGLIPVKVQKAILERIAREDVLKRSRPPRLSSMAKFRASRRLGGFLS